VGRVLDQTALRGGSRPTIADVARKASVGAITVSRALREPEQVSEDLRRQIQIAVRGTRLCPDPNAGRWPRRAGCLVLVRSAHQ
jgi:LacI family gluconate utilization system Gnt-I transcriptional repressor